MFYETYTFSDDRVVFIEKLTSEGCWVMGFNSSYETMGFLAHCEGLRSAASYLAWETTILSGWAVEKALLAARGALGWAEEVRVRRERCAAARVMDMMGNPISVCC